MKTSVGASILADLASLWFQAPMVIAARSQAMAVAAMSGSTSEYAETSRMVTEKVAAAAESVLAANMAMVKEGMSMAAAFAVGKTVSGGHDRVTAAALRPMPTGCGPTPAGSRNRRQNRKC